MTAEFVLQEGLDRHKAETGHGTPGRRSTGRPPVNVGSFYCEFCKTYYHNNEEFTKHNWETHPELEEPSENIHQELENQGKHSELQQPAQAKSGNLSMSTDNVLMASGASLVPGPSILGPNVLDPTLMFHPGNLVSEMRPENMRPSGHNPALVQFTQDAAGKSFMDRIDRGQMNKHPEYGTDSIEAQPSSEIVDSQSMKHDSTLLSGNNTRTKPDILTSGGFRSDSFVQNDTLFSSKGIFQGTNLNINTYNETGMGSLPSANTKHESPLMKSKSGGRTKDKKVSKRKVRKEKVDSTMGSSEQKPEDKDEFKNELPIDKESLLQGVRLLQENIKHGIKSEPYWEQEGQVSDHDGLEVKTEFLSDSLKTSEPKIDPEPCEDPESDVDSEREDFFKQTEELSKRRHKCHMCLKAFKKTNHLRRHMKTHDSGENVFQCHSCSQKFTSQEELTQHVEQHVEAVGKYVCRICGKACEYESVYDYHMLTHSAAQKTPGGTAPCHVCTECNQSFTRPYLLRRHIQVKHQGKV